MEDDIREALRYLKEQQKVLGRPGFGYDIRRRKLIPNTREQAVIEQVLAWRQAGLSYRDIAVMLNANGEPTKRGGVWQPKTVQKIVRRVSA